MRHGWKDLMSSTVCKLLILALGLALSSMYAYACLLGPDLWRKFDRILGHGRILRPDGTDRELAEEARIRKVAGWVAVFMATVLAYGIFVNLA
jgi:hypothetical protein